MMRYMDHSHTHMSLEDLEGNESEYSSLISTSLQIPIKNI